MTSPLLLRTDRTGAPAPVRLPHLAIATVVAKVLLAACLLHALAFPALAQYQDKAMGLRLVVYPVLVAAVPVGWLLRGRRHAYPWLLDLCFTLPFLFDSLGNAANLYDTVTWWDDAMHLATWLPLVVGLGLALRRRIPDPLSLGLVALGLGAVTHIGWEVGEYLTFVADSPTESLSAYRDTIGDLVMSLVGSALGAAIVFAAARAQADAS